MAKAKTKPVRRRTKAPAAQLYIEGTEPPRIKEIDDAASDYFEVMTDRCKLSKEEAAAKTALIEAMHKHGQTVYETKNNLKVTVLSKSNVKCKLKHAVEDNGDGEEDE